MIGHSHADHLLDAPYISQFLADKCDCRTRIIGSASTKIVVDKATGDGKIGISVENDSYTGPVKLLDDFQPIPDASYIPIRSRHGISKLFGIPNPGQIEDVEVWPTDYGTMKCGSVLNWHVTLRGRSVLHIGSANLESDELRTKLKGVKTNVLCLCAASWNGPNGIDYIKLALEITKPEFVIPCHWDWFFGPPNKSNPKLFPRLKLDEFINAIKEEAKCLAKPPTCVFVPIDGVFKY